jgi:hypothetical protein
VKREMTTSDHVEYLRTMVRGQFEENDRIEKRLDSNGWGNWSVFLASCFYLAVDRHFDRPADSDAIVRFVADMRIWIGDDGPQIDPALAETLIRSVLDDSVDVDMQAMDQDMLGRVETLVVYQVLSTSDLSDAELDAFFNRANRMVSRNT